MLIIVNVRDMNGNVWISDVADGLGWMGLLVWFLGSDEIRGVKIYVAYSFCLGG